MGRKEKNENMGGESAIIHHRRPALDLKEHLQLLMFAHTTSRCLAHARSFTLVTLLGLNK